MAGGSPEDLRRRFAHTVLFEVRTADYTAAERTLMDWDAVHETYLHGPRIHAFAEPGTSIEDVAAHLGPGSAHASIRRITPSMEDIFIMLTSARDEEREAPS